MKKIKEFIKKNEDWFFATSLLLIIFGYSALMWHMGYTRCKREITTPNVIYVDNIDTIPDFLFKEPKNGLKDALEYYHVQYADIVYAQAVLETGDFTSYQCTENNNLFGLYNSKSKKYMRFLHWSESVKAYVKYVQYKYKSGNYYDFLENLGYAEDKGYIDKVKKIVEQNKK